LDRTSSIYFKQPEPLKIISQLSLAKDVFDARRSEECHELHNAIQTFSSTNSKHDYDLILDELCDFTWYTILYYLTDDIRKNISINHKYSKEAILQIMATKIYKENDLDAAFLDYVESLFERVIMPTFVDFMTSFNIHVQENKVELLYDIIAHGQVKVDWRGYHDFSDKSKN
jgi:NTP pyrophosphatase (non-canonical NTP hydrolase)